MQESEDETYTVPLRDQRYFGAGIRKQTVHFVAASKTDNAIASSADDGQTLTAAERYRRVVLRPSEADTITAPSSERTEAPASAIVETAQESGVLPEESRLCEKCHLPVATSGADVHATSLAHQVCLDHTHPPSAIQRTRKGLAIMRSSGWNPDKRVGLGSSGTGILYPIKAHYKEDRYGVGINKDSVDTLRPSKVRKLDAGKMQQLDKAKRKRCERLSRSFYGHDDLLKHLGEG